MGIKKLDAELDQLNSELKKNNSEAEKIRADLVLFETFNESLTRKEILVLIDAFKQKKAAFDEPPILSIVMPSPVFFGRIFGLGEPFDTRQKQAETENMRYKDELALEIAKLDAQIKAGQALIERHKSLDEYQLRAMIKTYECREKIIQGKIQSVLAKREKLQLAIGPLFENAAQYRQQVRDCEHGLKACQAYLEQLATYHDAPAKLRKVYEACAEQFNGNGRPSDVAYNLNKKLEVARRQLIQAEDRIDDEIKKMDTESVVSMPMLNVEINLVKNLTFVSNIHPKKIDNAVLQESRFGKSTSLCPPLECESTDKAEPLMGKKSKVKDALDQGISQFQGAWNQVQGNALNKALSDYGKGIRESISNKSGVINGQSMDVQQGFVAEAHHVGSFNIEAAAKGQNNHRATLDVGKVNDPVADIRVTTPNGSSDHQVKFYKDGEKTAAALSPEKYDGVGKIVPSDQVDTVQASARKQSLRNKDTRPEVSKSNQDTADNATDKLTSGDGKVSSKGLNRKGKGSAEELAKDARKNENGPEYKDKTRVRGEFNSMQYHNAAKAGAIAGAASESVSILLEYMRRDQPLDMDQCLDAAQRVVLSSVKGASNALLITGVQHAGQSLIDAAAAQTGKTIGRTLGKQLIKGNVAAAVSQITVQLAQNLYKFSNGEIDSIEFASSTIGGTMQVVGGSLAYGLGVGAGTYLGTFVTASVSGYAIGGTTLGALGVMASGAVFAVGFSLAAGAYVNHFSAKGVMIANEDLKSALELLNSGSINLSQYVGKVGIMSEQSFIWTDLLPFSGAISVISEYSTRKNQLKAVQNNIYAQLEALPEQERQMMQELVNEYTKEIANIDRQYEEARRSITNQAFAQFDAMGKELNDHLEMQYLMFTPVRKNYIEHSEMMDVERRKQEEKNERSQAFAAELEVLQEKLNTIDISDQTGRALKKEMQKTILDRMELIIPDKTGWDQACEFLELH
ncbi:hypothetical protein [Methylomicrobium album]|uniref:Uncharacterized protein n=1 Tax=Methylomicrobium album BG8 TaxID=686340 RepID=H8GI24_METAL|nr:hypothetical protein [Methylomicrobium album]EIC30168.1 hypothetical protein Metal_2446 [Methylomicrobium album BG8]